MKSLLVFLSFVTLSSAGSFVPMTAQLKAKILKKHNDYRVAQHSSNMDEMEWDDVLAKEAADWMSSCQFEHQMKTRGENLAFDTDTDNNKVIDTAFENWYNEIKDYRYDQRSCAPMSCHYTQLVWAHTNKVGCAFVNCPSLGVNGRSVPNAKYFGCFYTPKGNDISEFPYLRGKACSHCMKGQTCSVDGLCRGEGIAPCLDKYTKENPGDDCRFWAKQGECTGNRPFMEKECKKSCKFCKPQPGEEDEEEEGNGSCENDPEFMTLHRGRPKCEVWKEMGECTNNAEFMSWACMKSCNKC